MGSRFFSRFPKGSHLTEKILHTWWLQCYTKNISFRFEGRPLGATKHSCRPQGGFRESEISAQRASMSFKSPICRTGWSRLNLMSQGDLRLTHQSELPILRLTRWDFPRILKRHSLMFHCACSVADRFSKQTQETKITHR